MSIALALIAASTQQAAPTPRIELRDRNIRVGDLAIVDEAQDVIIGAIPSGQQSVEIEVRDAQRLLTNRLPSERFTLRHMATITLAAPIETLRTGTCFEALKDINPGAQIIAEYVSETACRDETRAPGLAYDRGRNVPVARLPILSGEYLGQVRPVNQEVTDRGSQLTFRTAAGPVMIERQVLTLQPGRVGERVFARTDDGEVISAPLIGDQETSE